MNRHGKLVVALFISGVDHRDSSFSFLLFPNCACENNKTNRTFSLLSTVVLFIEESPAEQRASCLTGRRRA